MRLALPGWGLWKDTRGIETTEIAVAVVLFAFVAGAAFLFFGNQLVTFFGELAGFLDTSGIIENWDTLTT